ncbi:hypothetical protein A2368_00570 [Candidatus Collierbacteria bacterium RIFOXYB1_FULL_49_13]|uniref:Uncharacterized protein n=1 Tax=Candidatus Collierbacteria bacterium RIFOXYB1_FULL_49_13 TaxID=1817728 RepID=A0A1F5FHD9_9BACT|nr:MAG: hypothetical protein A2368_00570 [Candidatus Collierbacteria bacterium RIFOXYB1_FULL_49_13]
MLLHPLLVENGSVGLALFHDFVTVVVTLFVASAILVSTERQRSSGFLGAMMIPIHIGFSLALGLVALPVEIGYAWYCNRR